ncbi:MAG: polyprenyl synthetase family protein [Holophagaceae bacterium]
MSIVTSARIFDSVRGDLSLVESELSRLLTQNKIEVIDKFSSHILNTSGKRLRPALLLLSTKAFNVSSEIAIRFACVFELIHTATLIHDDVIDHSATRRGSKTLNALWGNNLTVLFGDLLYLRAMSSAIEGRNWRMMEVLSEVTSKVIEGELIQHDHLFDIHLNRDQYFDILERKTALLYTTLFRSGPILSGAPTDIVRDLETYGLHLGRAFQLIDDLLDYSSTESQLGKPVFTDLKEGKLTLPLLLLKDVIPKIADPLIEDFWSMNRTAESLNSSASQLKTLLLQHQTLEQTYNLAKEETEKALAILDTPFYKSDSFSFLKILPNLLLDRIK